MARAKQYPASVDAGLPVGPPLPAGWQSSRFGSLLEVVERPVRLEGDVEYQLVIAKRSRGGIVSRARRVGREILTKSQFQIRAGDFLISRRQIIHGACGLVPAALDGAIVSNEYATLRARREVLPEFLGYLSYSSYFQRTCFHSSVGVDVEKMVFRLENWLRYEVQVPPIPEQRKIVAVLSSLDETIERSEAVAAELDAFRRAILAELLTAGVERRSSRLVPLQEEWRLGRVVPGLEAIPESWRLVRLTDVARLESGHTPSRARSDYWDGEIPWISLHDSKGLDVPEITNTSQTVSALGIANSSARLLPPGTVVLSRTATVGKATIMGREMATSQDFANYVCGPEVNNRYLMQLFRFMQPEWRRLMAGSTHQTVYMPIFENLQVLLPPIPEQVEIADIAESIDSRIHAERSVAEELRGFKAGLVTRLVTGVLRVTPDEAVA